MLDTSGPSIQDQLAELKAAVAENTRMLKAIRRDALVSTFLKIFVWVGLFVLSIYLSWTFLEPALKSVTGAEGGNSIDLQKILEQYQSQMGQ
jgi:hypothetical protein